MVSIEREPYPVLDVRTGKRAGQFPAAARVHPTSRLSPDGRYLASSAFEVRQVPQRRVTKDELVVWQRDADRPACRWPLPGPVLWADFIGPDRLALYHTTPNPQFVVLDVTTGTPSSPSCPEHTLSPDGKTLLRLGTWSLNAQVWDLETGKRKGDPEAPMVPLTLAAPDRSQAAGVRRVGARPDAGLREPRLGVFWVGPRWVLSKTKSPVEQQPRYYLYDLDAHTHTYRYDPGVVGFQNDSLGRAWMQSRAEAPQGGAPQAIWTAPDVPGAAPFRQTLAFGPGSTVRVEVDVGGREDSRRAAEKVARELQARGLKIGRDGWVLRADHKTGTASTNLTDLRGQGGISVVTLTITWRLLDPEVKEAWQGTSGGKFDPFISKYVVVGSRRTEMSPGAGAGALPRSGWIIRARTRGPPRSRKSWREPCSPATPSLAQCRGAW